MCCAGHCTTALHCTGHLQVVILDFQHLYQFSAADHRDLILFLMGLFGPQLVSWQVESAGASLSELVGAGRRVVVVYPNPGHDCPPAARPLLWPRQLCPTPWPDTMDPNSLASFLRAGAEHRNTDTLFVSQVGGVEPSDQFMLACMKG